MTMENSSEMINAGCCKNRSCTETELKQYRIDVRTRIAENDGTIFPNNCPDKTAIVLQEFIKAAERSVHIYCGRLNAAVYEDLKPDFEDAIARGVEVRVVCAYKQISAKSLAEKLRVGDHFRQLSEELELPHFAVVDGRRFRIETDQKSKEAFVCAYATDEQLERVRRVEMVHRMLWEIAS